MASFKFDTKGMADPLIRARQGLAGTLQNLGRGFGDRRREKDAKDESEAERALRKEMHDAEMEEKRKARLGQAHQFTQTHGLAEELGLGSLDIDQLLAALREREVGVTEEQFDLAKDIQTRGMDLQEETLEWQQDVQTGEHDLEWAKQRLDTLYKTGSLTDAQARTALATLGVTIDQGRLVMDQARSAEAIVSSQAATLRADLLADEDISSSQAATLRGKEASERADKLATYEMGERAHETSENALNRELERARIDLAALEAGNLATYRNAMIAQQGGAADAAELVPVDKSTLAYEMFQYAKLQLMEMNSVIDEQTGQPTLNWSTDDPEAYVELKNKMFRIANDHAIERLVAAGETEEGIKEFLDRAALELLDQIPGPPVKGDGIITPGQGDTSVAGMLLGGITGIGGAVAGGAADYVKNLSGLLRGTEAPRTVKGDVEDPTTEAFAWALVQKLQELDLTEEERRKLGNAGGVTPRGYEWDLQKPLKGGITKRLPEILNYVIQLAQQHGLGADGQ